MPSKIAYENQGEGVVITWRGSISGDELKRVNAQLYAKGRFEKLCYQIWDFTKAEGMEITTKDLRDLAMQDSIAAETNPKQVVAIVGSKELFSGYDQLFHIYEDIWSGYKSETFSTMAEAREWVSSTIDER